MRRFFYAAVSAAILCGCSGEVRRAEVFAVNLVSKDGKGWMHSGPIYSVGVKMLTGEQVWFISVHKLEPGMDVCVEWVPGSGYQVTRCDEAKPLTNP